MRPLRSRFLEDTTKYPLLRETRVILFRYHRECGMTVDEAVKEVLCQLVSDTCIDRAKARPFDLL